MAEQNIFEDLADAAHENAYFCAINDAYDVLKEMGMTAGNALDFIEKMKQMAEIRQATKFILTKD